MRLEQGVLPSKHLLSVECSHSKGFKRKPNALISDLFRDPFNNSIEAQIKVLCDLMLKNKQNQSAQTRIKICGQRVSWEKKKDAILGIYLSCTAALCVLLLAHFNKRRQTKRRIVSSLLL